ncbi:S8 family serine peptidase [Siansivirga zeaxanthinifaciens]|uniref:Serine protease n=1 Tax=Siansivirga zeaxanthinifaciens CC-SAMT-1 TaxID=1454006 RepID=A0A0C5WMC8_9FLAO|nr:S8 family serine peptidase [Siansivirga zeaxanthinifaciens]AJR04040.1 serine protease [Siansivirga zeaxanthinifaciens CC-SAMT-1]
MKHALTFVLCLLFQIFVFGQEDAWVYFTDKENVAVSIANPASILSQKAINRKNAHGIAIDARDVPVNENYIAQLKLATGITIKAKSKWFNAVHVRGTETNIKNLLTTPPYAGFIDHIDFANKNISTNKSLKQKQPAKLETILTDFNYGTASNQIEMFHGNELHLNNFTGTGITIAVLDAGFPNVNTMSSFERLRNKGLLLDGYDFVNRDNDVYTNTVSNHGTLVLSTMAGYIENQYVGTAPDASYYLFITEDNLDENPVEESYWVEAAERADSLGVDIINTSLGYTTYNNTNYSYTNSDMNGQTAFITKGANIAFEKGLLLVNSAGNDGNKTWQIVGAPADSPNVLSIGAVDASGAYAAFSSKGSTIQPSQKPDVVAQGQGSILITENDVIAAASGTSFSSPILAGGIACLWQALPNKTNLEIMQLVRASASQYTTPDYFLGYGIPNLFEAYSQFLAVSSNTVDNQIKIFPNPVTNKLFISIPEEASLLNVLVSDLLGNQLFSTTISKKNNAIDVSALSQGIYIIIINTPNKTQTLKFIKQ